MFECKICNFCTLRSYDLKRHKLSKRHVRIEHKFLNNNTNTNINLSVNDDSFYDSLNNIKTVVKDSDKEINKDGNKDALLETSMTNDHEMKPKKKVHVCECGKQFNNSGNLCRHRKICNKIPKEETLFFKDKISKLETELEAIKKQLAQSNNQQSINSNNKLHMTNTKICSDNTINNNNNNITNNNIINNKISVIAYLDAYHVDTPAIKLLEPDDITRILKNCELGKHLLEDVIVYQQSKYMLHEFIGEFILKEFKKNDPTKQHFWLVDLSRLKFAVRLALTKTNIIWQPDPKGIYLTKYIITPILDEIFSMMIDYKEICDKRAKTAETISQCDNIYKQSVNSVEIIRDINQKILHKKILKYIAPYFQLEIKI